MWRAELRAAVALAATVLAGGCDWYYNSVPSPDSLWHRVKWFDHMITAKYVHPYSRADVPRDTPAGSVPVSGGEASWRIGNPGELQYAFDQAVADRLVNPTTTGGTAPRPTVEVVRIPADLAARGDTLYQGYCAMCHGQAGAGNGPVGVKLGAPSLLTDRARGYTDGYLYSIVRYGRGLMPQYGDKIYDPLDRWAVVNHVRKLQAGAPAVAATGGMN